MGPLFNEVTSRFVGEGVALETALDVSNGGDPLEIPLSGGKSITIRKFFDGRGEISPALGKLPRYDASGPSDAPKPIRLDECQNPACTPTTICRTCLKRDEL